MPSDHTVSVDDIDSDSVSTYLQDHLYTALRGELGQIAEGRIDIDILLDAGRAHGDPEKVIASAKVRGLHEVTREVLFFVDVESHDEVDPRNAEAVFAALIGPVEDALRSKLECTKYEPVLDVVDSGAVRLFHARISDLVTILTDSYTEPIGEIFDSYRWAASHVNLDLSKAGFVTFSLLVRRRIDDFVVIDHAETLPIASYEKGALHKLIMDRIVDLIGDQYDDEVIVS